MKKLAIISTKDFDPEYTKQSKSPDGIDYFRIIKEDIKGNEKEEKNIILYKLPMSVDDSYKFIETYRPKDCMGTTVSFSSSEDYIIIRNTDVSFGKVIIVDKAGKIVNKICTNYFGTNKDSIIHDDMGLKYRGTHLTSLDGKNDRYLGYGFGRYCKIRCYNNTWIIHDSYGDAAVVTPSEKKYIAIFNYYDKQKSKSQKEVDGAYIIDPEENTSSEIYKVYNINGDFVDKLGKVVISDEVVAGIPDGYGDEYIFYKSIFNDDGSTEVERIDVFPVKKDKLKIETFTFFDFIKLKDIERKAFKNEETRQIYDITEEKVYNDDDYHVTSKVDGYKYYIKYYYHGKREIYNENDELIITTKEPKIISKNNILLIDDYLIDLKRGIKRKIDKNLMETNDTESYYESTTIDTTEDGCVIVTTKHKKNIETTVFDKNFNFLTKSFEKTNSVSKLIDVKNIRIIIVDGVETLVYRKNMISPYIDAEGNEYNIKDYQEVEEGDIYIEYDPETKQLKDIQKYFKVKGTRDYREVTKNLELDKKIEAILNYLAITCNVELAESFTKTLDSYNKQLESMMDTIFDREISKIEDNPFMTRDNTFETPESIDRKIDTFVNSYIEVINKASELLDLYRDLTSIEKLLQHEKIPKDLSEYSLNEYMPLINHIYELTPENKKLVSDALCEDIKIAKHKINQYIKDIVLDGIVEEQEIIDTKKAIMMNLNKTYLKLSNNLIVSIEKEKIANEEHYKSESGRVFADAENHIIENYKKEFKNVFTHIAKICEKYMDLNDTPSNKKLTAILNEYLAEANQAYAEISESNNLKTCKESLVMIYRIQDRVEKVMCNYLILQKHELSLKSVARNG